jgi:hypothetical protein
VVDSPTGMGLRATHLAEARALVQPPKEVPLIMSGAGWLQKHTKEGAPTKEPQDSR